MNFLHLFLSSVIVINSSEGSPVHILMLSIQAVRGLPHPRAPGIVPRIISFSRQLPFPHGMTIVCFLALTVSNSTTFTPALLRSYWYVFFAVHETCRIFLSPFISKASKRVSSFFLRVQSGWDGKRISEIRQHSANYPDNKSKNIQLFCVSRMLLQATLALSLVVSSLKSVCWLFHMSCSDARSPALCLTFYAKRSHLEELTSRYPPKPCVLVSCWLTFEN